jgi:heptosyltransferase-2
MLSWPRADQWLTQHVVDRYRATAKGASDRQGLDISPESVDIPLPSAYNALVVGAKQFTKRIPVESLRHIALQSDLPIVLIGGPDDSDEAESVLSGLPVSKVINLTGSLTLRQSVSVLAGARRIVSPDTGMMHVATALQKPVAVLWGSTTPELGFAPFYGGSGLAEIEEKRREAGALSCSVDLPCRPCTRTGFDACPQGHFQCMKNQDLNRVIEWLNEPS